jgi:uncharacterized membrane protein
MEMLFNAVSLALFAGAIATFVAIVREVVEQLDEVDRATLRAWFRFSSVTTINRAIANAWRHHVQYFPKSRKRILFASLLVAACLSVMGYPLWLALVQRA